MVTYYVFSMPVQLAYVTLTFLVATLIKHYLSPFIGTPKFESLNLPIQRGLKYVNKVAIHMSAVEIDSLLIRGLFWDLSLIGLLVDVVYVFIRMFKPEKECE